MKITTVHSPAGVAHKPVDTSVNSEKQPSEPSAGGPDSTAETASDPGPAKVLPEQARGAPAHVARELLVAQSVTDGSTDRNLFGRLVSLIARGKSTDGLLGTGDDQTVVGAGEGADDAPVEPDGSG